MTKTIPAKILKHRKPEYPVDNLFVSRWSPRAMSGKKITKTQLMTLFEAAKWAPSCYNAQEWRFVYAMKGTKHWDTLFNLLGDFNKMWCKDASALIVLSSRKTYEWDNKPIPTYSFDVGAAWQNLALQASMDGLVAHGMAGFDYAKAAKDLNIPSEYKVEAMIAVGKPGKKSDLPKDLQEREILSARKKIKEIAFEGKFKK